MNLGEFRKLTAYLPDSIDLFIGERVTDFGYGLVNSATVKEIAMTEESDGTGEKAFETVLILDEE